MKSLEERQQQRAQQRALLSHGGVVALPEQEGQDKNTGSADQFDAMTIDQLKEWVKAQDGGVVEVPKDVTKRDDVLKFARNYAEYLTEKAGQTNSTGAAWNGQ